MSDEPLQRKIRELKPARLRVMLVDDTEREFRPNGTGRKMWMHALDAIPKLNWLRVELVDTKNVVLAFHENADQVVELERDHPSGCPTCGHSPMDVLKLTKLVVEAQKEALSWQDKSVRAALDTSVSVMRELGGAVMTLSQVHQMALDEAKAVARAVAAGGHDDLTAGPLLQALAPQLIAKLTGAAPPPTPPANGSKNGAH